MDVDTVTPPELARLTGLVEAKPEAFASGDEDIRIAALAAAKHVFDIALRTEATSIRHIAALLASLSPATAPQTRAQAKRKRDPSPVSGPPPLQPTPLAGLFVDGADAEQVWAQLELKSAGLCDTLRFALDATGAADPDELGLEDDDEGAGPAKKARVRAVDEEEDLDMADLEDMEGFDSEEDEDMDDDEDSEETDDDGEDAESTDNEDLGEAIQPLRDPSEDEDEGEGEGGVGSSLFSHIKSALKRADKPKPARRGGHPELDDDFFSLAEFNAETERAEARKSSRGRLGGDDDDDEVPDTGEDLDLFAPVDEDGDDAMGEEPEAGYDDFFAPPPKPFARKPSAAPPVPPREGGKVRFHDSVRVKNIKARGKNVPLSALNMLKGGMGDDDDDEDDDEFDVDGDEGAELGEEDDEEEEGDEEDEEMGFGDVVDGDESEDEDLEDEGLQTMERFRDDLFAEDEEEESADAGMTSHAKRQAELREQIAELEAQNVGPKDWQLLGEAGARARPQNSLLEEDLDFERVMKAVPVITEAAVQSLEERIKARVLAGAFDDVVRARAADARPFLPSRAFALDDTKSKQSLAEIYEGEYVAAQAGGAAGDDRDGKLKKEHDEIQKLWDGICYKLDALCNAHFTPKPPKATISTVSNVAAASMESALPTTRATATMLAPEEVFAPASADVRARSELTPGEKRATRNRSKKAHKKEHAQIDAAAVGAKAAAKGLKGVKKEKEEALKSIVKAGRGVTVVGKKNKEIADKVKGKRSK